MSGSKRKREGEGADMRVTKKLKGRLCFLFVLISKQLSTPSPEIVFLNFVQSFVHENKCV